MTDAADHPRSPWLRACAVYAALTLAVTWPLALHLSTMLAHDAGDPALATWILWWDAHAVPLTERWWNAPIFWPATGVFAFSEHLLGVSIVTTPLQWLGLSPLAAYNIAFLLSFPLGALAAHGLAFCVTKRHDAALVGGLVFGFNPYRMAQLPHIQMLWTFGMPLALIALHRYVEGGRRAWLGVFAAAWLTLALSNGYYLLFFPVLLGCWGVWFLTGRPIANTKAIVATWIAASLPLLPVLLKYRQIHAALHLERGIGEIEFFSADLTSLIAASPDQILWHALSRWSKPEGQLFPGALALALIAWAAASAAWTARREPREPSHRFRRTRRTLMVLGAAVAAVGLSPLVIGPWQIARGSRVLLSVSSPDKPFSIALPMLALALVTGPAFRRIWQRRSAFAFYTLGAALMFVLSLGPRVRLAGVRVMFTAPYAWLLALPGFSELRAPGRFGMLFVLCVAVGAGLAFARLTTAFGARRRRIFAGAAAVIVLAESWSSMALVAPPAPIPALAGIGGGGPVVELPVGVLDRDIAAEYRSIGHGHPVVNGWGGYDPLHYLVLRTALRLGDGGALSELARGLPLTVVIDHQEGFDRWSALVEEQHGQPIADDGRYRVYRLRMAPAPAPAADDGAPLAVQSIVANVGNDEVGRLRDGDPATHWNSQRLQEGGEELRVDLGRERHVAVVRLAMGTFISDYPRQLIVDCAGDASDWAPCWNGSSGATALRAVLDDTANPRMSIPIGRDGVRRLRLRQIGVDRTNGWSIAELTVFGR